MATIQYTGFIINNNLIDICNATGTDSLGVETAATAVDKVGGLEHITKINLDLFDSAGVLYHNWSKTFNHYMKAGSTYSFYSAVGFKLPSGNYTCHAVIYTDNVNAGTLPELPASNSIPAVL